MEEMIGESIRPHVEMMSTAEKIKEAFSTLDSINLQKFDLVSKAMAAATDFVHQLIKTSMNLKNNEWLNMVDLCEFAEMIKYPILR